MGRSFGVDFGLEWSQILISCHPSRTGFYDWPTDSGGEESVRFGENQ